MIYSLSTSSGHKRYSGALTSTFNGKASEVFVNVPTSSHPKLCPNHPGPINMFIDMKNIIRAASMYVKMLIPNS